MQNATFNPDVEQSADEFSVFSTEELLSLGLIDESVMEESVMEELCCDWTENEVAQAA